MTKKTSVRTAIDPKVNKAIREERRTRGKRGPAAFAAEEERKQIEMDLDRLLRRGTEAEFLAKIKTLQLPSESGGVEKLLKLFHELRRS